MVIEFSTYSVRIHHGFSTYSPRIHHVFTTYSYRRERGGRGRIMRIQGCLGVNLVKRGCYLVNIS